jgi:hypothetical protein
MKPTRILPLAFAGLALGAGIARANCFPVKSDVVSLGEKAARFYADRSLTNAIDDQKRLIESTGSPLGRIARAELNCQPFPNLIGADEWHCTGEAKVCTGDAASKNPPLVKAANAASSRRAKTPGQKPAARAVPTVADPKQ